MWQPYSSPRGTQLHGRAANYGSTLRDVRTLPHIKKLDDALGHFRVRITCKCGAARECEPEALARIAGPSATLESVSKPMRCSKCGAKGAEVVAIAIPRPRGGR